MKKKKILALFLEVFIVLCIFLYFFTYIDVKNSCYILIIPTYLPSNISTKKVIKLIKNASPDDYCTLCSYINVINKNISCGGFDGGCYEQINPRTIFLGNDQNSLALSAAIVIHELCHREQARQGRQFSELECYKKGSEFLENIVVH